MLTFNMYSYTQCKYNTFVDAEITVEPAYLTYSGRDITTDQNQDRSVAGHVDQYG